MYNTVFVAVKQYVCRIFFHVTKERTGITRTFAFVGVVPGFVVAVRFSVYLVYEAIWAVEANEQLHWLTCYRVAHSVRTELRTGTVAKERPFVCRNIVVVSFCFEIA